MGTDSYDSQRAPFQETAPINEQVVSLPAPPNAGSRRYPGRPTAGMLALRGRAGRAVLR